jgi:DNA-binding transcriptional LysR family regulator
MTVRPPAPAHTLDQLVVLEAIAEEGSFAAAARRLHRVPSAVSYVVAGLEAAVGVPVFDRGGHRAELTAAGRRILDAGGEVLRAARRLDALGRTLAQGWEPAVQLVVDGALPMGPIIESVRDFAGEGATTRVRLDVEYQGGVAEVFERDRAALMLVLEHDGAADHEAAALPAFDMVLVAHRDHALGAGPATREALTRHVELVVKDSSGRFAATPRESWFRSAHVLHLSDFHSKRIALEARAGYGWMPRHLIDDLLEEDVLRVIEVDVPTTWTYRPALVSRGHGELGPAASTLRARLLLAFGRES